MTDEDGNDLSRRLHWDPEKQPPDQPADEPVGDAERWDDEAGGVAENASTETGLITADPVADARSFEQRNLDQIDADALDRRRQLWRDTAIILSGLVAVLLVANLVLPQIAGPAASPSPGASGLSAGPSPSALGAAGPTQEPTLDPGLGSGGRSTPIPAITLPPTGTFAPATPRPIPTPRPTRTPRPPTPPPPTPRPTERPTPAPTPIPPPSVHVSCTAAALTASCTATMTDAVAGSETWAMGGAGIIVTGGDGSDSITFLYDAEGTYHVVVTITGRDGSTTSDGTDVSVSVT